MGPNNQDDFGVKTGTMVAGGVAGLLTLGFGALLGWMFRTRTGRRVLLAIVAGLVLLFLGRGVWVAFQDGRDLCADKVEFLFNYELGVQTRKNQENKGKTPSTYVFWTDLSDRASHVQQMRFDWKQGEKVVRSKIYTCHVNFDGSVWIDRGAGR